MMNASNSSIPSIDRRKLYKNFLCGICDKIIQKTAMLKACSCRFCHSCIMAAYGCGEKSCPNPRCPSKPRPQLRVPLDEIVLNESFDQLIRMCGFRPHQAKEEFLDSISLARLASQNVHRVTTNRKRTYLVPPDITTPRKSTFKWASDQINGSSDSEKAIAQKFFDLSNWSCAAHPLETNFAKSRWILVRRRLREKSDDEVKPRKRRSLSFVESGSDESESEVKVSRNSYEAMIEENEMADSTALEEESDISDSSDSENENHHENGQIEEPNQTISSEMTEDELLEKTAREIYMAEQQRIEELAQQEDPKHPLVLWPDMRLEVKGIQKSNLHAHYLFVPESATMETLGKFVLMRLFQEEDLELNKEDLTVAFVPIVEEIEATNIVILRRESKTDPANKDKTKDHAVTLKIENPAQASVLIFDYPSPLITKKSTMAQVRAELWRDRTRPMKLIYQIKQRSADESRSLTTESPTITPSPTEIPPTAMTPISSTSTSTPTDPTPTTPKDPQSHLFSTGQHSLVDPKSTSDQMIPHTPPIAPPIPQYVNRPILSNGMARPLPPLTSPLPTAPPILQIVRPNIPFLSGPKMNDESRPSSSQQMIEMSQPIPMTSHLSFDPRIEFNGNESRNSSGGESDGMPTLDPEI